MAKAKYLKVPFYIIIDLELTWQQKFIYAEIIHLHEQNGCYASNKHFCDLFNIKADVCSRIIKALKLKGYIKKESGYFKPLKIDQKSIKQYDEKLTKSQIKIDQKSNEVDQKSNSHHIYKENNREQREEIPAQNDDLIEDAILEDDNGQLNEEKKKKEKKGFAQKKEKDYMPLDAMEAITEHLRQHPGELEVIKAMMEDGSNKAVKELIAKMCFWYGSERQYLINQFATNPRKGSAKLGWWASREKELTKKVSRKYGQKKTGARLTEQQERFFNSTEDIYQQFINSQK